MEIASTGRVSGHIKTDWLIIAKGGVFTGNVTELEGLFILLPVRTVIRPEGPGWTGMAGGKTPSQKIAHVVRDDPQEQAHPFIALLWRTRFLG